jgi:integrase
MLLAEFKVHNEEYLKSVGITKSKGSYDSYDHACKVLGKFITQKCELEDIAFKELQSSFITGFEFFLRVDLGCAPATVFNVVMKLKRMIRRAVNQEIIRKNPFAGFQCEPGGTTRKWLSKTELDTIMHTALEDRKAEQLRLLFIFAAFTGLAFADLYNLRNKNISTDNDGITWIRIRRKKTGTQAVVPLLEIPLRIYNKYRNPGAGAEKKVFAVPSYPLARIYLEKVRVAAKLKTLKFHYARHSYSTTVCLSNGVPIETLSRMLGHKNISTTQIYAKITHRKVEEDMQALEKRLDGKYHLPQYCSEKQEIV